MKPKAFLLMAQCTADEYLVCALLIKKCPATSLRLQVGKAKQGQCAGIVKELTKGLPKEQVVVGFGAAKFGNLRGTKLEVCSTGAMLNCDLLIPPELIPILEECRHGCPKKKCGVHS